MSTAPEQSAAPATPAGRPARPDRGRQRWIVLLLVLAALFGTGTAATVPTVEASTAVAPAADPGGETHDPAATEAGPSARARRHGAGLRPVTSEVRPHGGPSRPGIPASAAVPVPFGDVPRCVVMRC
ncbi:hypothetical protein ACFW2Y_20640 [Streptomyces sp. NPDC058877]|uniref:hypothetical protein n=1 Tax=unclassified Streptomyces TaxID=2593676 RepID=UPI0036D13B4E